MTSLSLKYKNYVSGQWCVSQSLRSYEIRNPADWNQVIHCYPKCSAQDVKKAVESASQAFATWKQVALADKASIMRRTAELIRVHRGANRQHHHSGKWQTDQ